MQDRGKPLWLSYPEKSSKYSPEGRMRLNNSCIYNIPPLHSRMIYSVDKRVEQFII